MVGGALGGQGRVVKGLGVECVSVDVRAQFASRLPEACSWVAAGGLPDEVELAVVVLSPPGERRAPGWERVEEAFERWPDALFFRWGRPAISSQLPWGWYGWLRRGLGADELRDVLLVMLDGGWHGRRYGPDPLPSPIPTP